MRILVLGPVRREPSPAPPMLRIRKVKSSFDRALHRLAT
jgi:hypothetical protein